MLPYSLELHLSTWADIFTFFSQYDKVKHITISAIILIFDFVMRYYFLSPKQKSLSLVFAIRDTFMIGVLKEILDSFWYGTPDIWDLIGDIVWFSFPIYLYFLSREIVAFDKQRLFKYWDDILKQWYIDFVLLAKEGGEWLFAYIQYLCYMLNYRFSSKASIKKELFLIQKQKNKEVYEAKWAFKKLRKSLLFGGRFLIFSIIEFLIKIIKMPLYILLKTLYILCDSLTKIFKILLKSLL